MSAKQIIQEVFDKAIIELSSTGMIKQTNYAIIAEKELIPLECDNLKRSYDQTTVQNMVALELARIDASGWITVGVGAMMIHDKVEEKPKRKTKVKPKKETKVKTKKKVAPQNTILTKEPVLSLITIHRTKTGKTEILYSKLLQDPKGTYYTDAEEKWIDRQEDLKLTEQN